MLKHLQALAAKTNQIMTCLDTAAIVVPVSTTLAQPPVSWNTPVHHLDAKALLIQRYGGPPEVCHSFLCSFTFELQPYIFPTAHSRVAFVITNFTGKLANRATTEWDRHPWTCNSVVAFSAALGCVFSQPVSGREASHGLGNLRQGNTHVFDQTTVLYISQQKLMEWISTGWYLFS